MALPPALLRPRNSTLKFNATKNSIGTLDFKFISKTYFVRAVFVASKAILYQARAA